MPSDQRQAGLYDAVISDPLVVAWRKFSDQFMDPEYRHDPKRHHIRVAFAAGWDAAAALAVAQVPAAGLDVDALRHAIAREFTYTGPHDYRSARAIVNYAFDVALAATPSAQDEGTPR